MWSAYGQQRRRVAALKSLSEYTECCDSIGKLKGDGHEIIVVSLL